MEKIYEGQNSIQRYEVPSDSEERGGRKAIQQVNFLFSSEPKGQIVPQNYNFGASQFIQHIQLLIKSPSTNILQLFCIVLRHTR